MCESATRAQPQCIQPSARNLRSGRPDQLTSAPRPRPPPPAITSSPWSPCEVSDFRHAPTCSKSSPNPQQLDWLRAFAESNVQLRRQENTMLTNGHEMSPLANHCRNMQANFVSKTMRSAESCPLSDRHRNTRGLGIRICPISTQLTRHMCGCLYR